MMDNRIALCASILASAVGLGACGYNGSAFHTSMTREEMDAMAERYFTIGMHHNAALAACNEAGVDCGKRKPIPADARGSALLFLATVEPSGAYVRWIYSSMKFGHLKFSFDQKSQLTSVHYDAPDTGQRSPESADSYVVRLAEPTP